jgi:hypothetical protein
VAGENDAVTPCGNPLAVSCSDDEKPLAGDPQLTAVDVEAPAVTVIPAGDAANVQAAGAVMVNDTVNVWVTEPPFAATCTT